MDFDRYLVIEPRDASLYEKTVNWGDIVQLKPSFL